MEILDSVNKSLIKNEKLTDQQTTMLYTGLSKIVNLVAKYEVDINFDDLLPVMDTISFETATKDKTSKSVIYEKSENKIIMNSSNTDNIEFDYFYSLLEIVIQRCSDNENGLVYVDENGQSHGMILNRMLLSRLSTLLSDNEDPYADDPFYYDNPSGITLKDSLMKDMIDALGFEKLISYFFDSRGYDMYCDISRMLESQELAKEFYNSIDNYDKDRIENRKIYDGYIQMLKENKLIDAPTL